MKTEMAERDDLVGVGVSQLGPTPGPWRVMEFNHNRRGPLQRRTIIGSNDQGFAETVGLSDPTDAANARLIAAAPDLLAALKALTSIPGPEDWQKARAAIRKAEGKEKELGP